MSLQWRLCPLVARYTLHHLIVPPPEPFICLFCCSCSCLKVESKCLARYDEEDIWYKATVVEIGENHDITVTFDSYDDECVTVPLEDILPIGMLDFPITLQKLAHAIYRDFFHLLKLKISKEKN